MRFDLPGDSAKTPSSASSLSNHASRLLESRVISVLRSQFRKDARPILEGCEDNFGIFFPNFPKRGERRDGRVSICKALGASRNRRRRPSNFPSWQPAAAGDGRAGSVPLRQATQEKWRALGRARQKSRSGTSGPHAGRRAGQRFAEILRAAFDLVSDLETSDSADETSSGGTLSARSASSADFARVMGMLELSSKDDDDLYHDRYCSPHALSPVEPDCSEVSEW